MSNTARKTVAQHTLPLSAPPNAGKLRDSTHVIRIDIKRICAIEITDLDGIMEVIIKILTTIEDKVTLTGFGLDEVMNNRNEAQINIKGICAIDLRSVNGGVEVEINTWTRIEAGQVLEGREIPVYWKK